MSIKEKKTGALDEEKAELNVSAYDPLVDDVKPYAFLRVHGCEQKLFEDVGKVFNISVREDHGQYVLVCSPKSENYKIDVLNLTAVALWLYSKNDSLSMFMGVSQSLRGMLLQYESFEKDILKGEQLEMSGYDFTKGSLTLTQKAQLAIHQSGVEIYTNSDYLVLNQIHMKKFFKSFTEFSTNKIKKVG